jgi:predicted nucleic acid-binding protein
MRFVLHNSVAMRWLLQEMCITPDTSQGAPLSCALGDTLQLARRFKLSSNDASYLELAMREGLPLATLDGDLRSAMLQTGTPLV